MQRDIRSRIYEPDPFWPHPLTVEKTGFKNKALGAFHANLAIGCSHGCRFCYVPSVSAAKQAKKLREMGVSHPVSGWGDYFLPRTWDVAAFRRSLRKAMEIPETELLEDGNRAVFYRSTTDPFQVSRHPKSISRMAQREQMEILFRRSLEIIRDSSDLRVRILTRSPLAEKSFDIMKSLGNRLLFGMSLPSLDDDLVRLYEPKAPGVERRLDCMFKAKEAGLRVYVAVAPTYPEQGIDDYRELLTVIKMLNPVTVFHEPINVRGKNVDLMEQHFQKEGQKFHAEAFRSGWPVYAARALRDFEMAAKDVMSSSRLKLWPDAALQSDDSLKRVVEAGIFPNPFEMVKWIRKHWARPSAWPSTGRRMFD